MAVPMGRLLVQNYRTISQDPTGGKCKLESTNRVEMNPGNPCRVDPRELCTASLILANSMSELSACTSIRGPLIPVWSTRRRKVPAARSRCTTRRNMGSLRAVASNSLLAQVRRPAMKTLPNRTEKFSRVASWRQVCSAPRGTPFRTLRGLPRRRW